MKQFLTRVFGPNYRTTLIGLMTGICYIVSKHPEALSGLSQNTQELIKSTVTFLIATGLINLGVFAKDVNVTGGTVPATKEAEVRVEKAEVVPE